MDQEFKKLITGSKMEPFLVIQKRIILLAKLVSLLVLLLLIATLFIRWTPTVKGLGQIIAFDPDERTQIIEAPIQGRIDNWHVQEGSAVKNGDLLAEIKDIDPERLDRIQNKITAVKDGLNALMKHEERTAMHVSRMKSLVQKGIESNRNYELAEIEHFKVIDETRKINIELLELETLLARQGSQEIRAHIDGTIMNIFAPAKTKIVKIGDPLARIIPQGVSLAAEVNVNGLDLPMIRAGQPVRIMFEGWPAVQLVGWPSVAVGTFPAKVAVIDQGDNEQGNFRAIIIPSDDTIWPTEMLRMGLKVKVWFLLKRVPLWWELWRRFSGVPPSV